MLDTPRQRLRRLFRLTRSVGGSALTVTWSRWREGPREPGWSWSYEVVLDTVRASFHKVSPSLAVTRERMDTLGRVGRNRRGVTWRRTTIAGVPCEWVEPEAGGRGVLVYLHGGGYVFGSTDSHAGLLADLALTSGRRVLSVEYRLAPEHPCPAAIEDVAAVWQALLADGLNPVALAGDSAGGGLALATTVHLRDMKVPGPDRLVLLSPWLDLAMTGEVAERHVRSDYLGTPRGIRGFAKHYLAGRPAEDPVASPLYADLRDLPPTLFIAGGAEVLLSDSLRGAERAREAGVAVTLHVEPNEVHVYPTFGRLTPHAADAFRRIRAHLEG